MPFTEADRARVAAAIEAAERETSGEIFCIYARVPHRYVEWLLALATSLAFLVPLAATLLGFGPGAWLALAEAGSWRDALPPLSEQLLVEAYALVQLVLFLLILSALWWSPLAQRRAPLWLRQRHVHELAGFHFLAQGLHLTEARTGVLLFVSVEDHVAEVLADEGIHAKVGEEPWVETVEALLAGLRRDDPAQGFCDAIALAGTVLARHFPRAGPKPNELPNRLLVV